MKNILLFFSVLIPSLFFIGACGVKKPPTPAYSMPKVIDPLAPSPTPKPGFSNPSGPLEESES